jgi:hypothetical protein
MPSRGSGSDVPRGFKKQLTEGLPLRLSWFEDERSFVSEPKIIKGECDRPKAHLVLYGEHDKGIIRAEIFRENRQANGGINRCWNCGQAVLEHETWITMELGEWDHIRNKPGERCDCVANGRVSCRECHRKRHPRPMLGQRRAECLKTSLLSFKS